MTEPVRGAAGEHRLDLRMVGASFVAGVGAMMLVGLAAPIAAKTSLTVEAADARTLEPIEPVIAPLDLAAVEAQLADAESALARSAAATDGAIARLERLSAVK